MKFIKTEIAGSDNMRYLFAVGKKESELMLGCLRATHETFPREKKWYPNVRRLSNMIRVIEQALPQIKGDRKNRTKFTNS